MRAVCGGLLGLLLVADPVPLPVAGQPLGEALKLLEARGLAVMFSSELVRPELRVLREPGAGTPREMLEQILAPHALGVRTGPGGRLLVVAMPRPAASPAQAPPSFSTAIDLVTVDAVVLDERGTPLTGLRPEDFTVYEDGVAQRITSFEAVDVPAGPERPPPARRPRATTNQPAGERGHLFVVVFDEVHLTALQAERAKEVLAGFLRTGLREGDLVVVAPTGGGAWWKARMNAGRRDVVAFLRHLKGLRPPETSTCAIGEYDALLFYRQRDQSAESRLLRWLNECNPTLDPPVVQDSGGGSAPDGRSRPESLRDARERRTQLEIAPGRGQLTAAAAAVYERANVRRRRTLETLVRVLQGLAPLRGRKLVLLVSEGFIDEPGLPESREVAVASLRANAAVFFLDARGKSLPSGHAGDAARLPEGRDQTGFLDQEGRLDDGAESVAAQTGGLTLRGGLADAWQQVAEESRAYYLLGYQPADTRRDGGLRKLRIEVARPGARVRARPAYYARSQAPATGDPLDPRVRGALDLAVAEGSVPLRLAAFVRAPAEQSRARTVLVAEADPSVLGLRESDGRLTGQVETFALVVSRETGAVTPLSQRLDVSLPVGGAGAAWLAIPGELALPPGTYQARVIVRGAGQAMGVVDHEFVVPPAGLRISSPVLTDSLDGGGRPKATALTRFPPKGRLYCQFEVYGAARDPQAGAPRVSARHVLFRSDGSVASASEFTPLASDPGGFPARTLAISVEGAAPGAYELSLEARDEVSGQTREAREPYVIEEGPPESRP
jgi:VWFA-related protein